MHPEHYDFTGPAFLPITLAQCQALLDDPDALSTLTDPELAAVLVVQHLDQAAQLRLDPNGAEALLGRLLKWAVSQAEGLRGEAQRLFDARKLYFGLEAIKGSKLQWLDADEVAAADYLLPDGTWDPLFRARRHQAHNPFTQQAVLRRDKARWVTTEQDKLLRVLRANPDEDLHVQGYAGIGKTYLLGALVDSLPAGRVLPLARTGAKLDTLRRRLGDHAGSLGRTFGALAQELLHGRYPQPASKSTRLPSKQAVAEQLGIMGLRHYPAEKALDIALEVLANYCHARGRGISARHLPHFEVALSPTEGQVLVEYAGRLWEWLQANPAWDRLTGLQALLTIKRASLAGCAVPARFSHVIVDESQDMPGPLLQLIERGRQVLITLGDEYQRASGPALRRPRQVRQRDVALSVRCGPQVERLINPLIGVHSQKSKITFEGASSVDVGVEFYPTGYVPPAGCVVLAASMWDAMRWALELSDAGCALGLADAADLRRFMTTAVQLYRSAYYASGEGADPAHAAFAHTTDWPQVQTEYRDDESFGWVQARLQDGFSMADINTVMARVSAQSGSVEVRLAQASGGLEFDQVLLTPALMTLTQFKDAYAFDTRVCAIYIALSRARRQLYLPYEVEEWVAFHKGQLFRETTGY